MLALPDVQLEDFFSQYILPGCISFVYDDSMERSCSWQRWWGLCDGDIILPVFGCEQLSDIVDKLLGSTPRVSIENDWLYVGTVVFVFVINKAVDGD